jgi:hypothetical protein
MPDFDPLIWYARPKAKRFSKTTRRVLLAQIVFFQREKQIITIRQSGK